MYKSGILDKNFDFEYVLWKKSSPILRLDYIRNSTCFKTPIFKPMRMNLLKKGYLR